MESLLTHGRLELPTRCLEGSCSYPAELKRHAITIIKKNCLIKPLGARLCGLDQLRILICAQGCVDFSHFKDYNKTTAI